jgi:hypothetical protein
MYVDEIAVFQNNKGKTANVRMIIMVRNSNV